MSVSSNGYRDKNDISGINVSDVTGELFTDVARSRSHEDREPACSVDNVLVSPRHFDA